MQDTSRSTDSQEEHGRHDGMMRVIRERVGLEGCASLCLFFLLYFTFGLVWFGLVCLFFILILFYFLFKSWKQASKSGLFARAVGVPANNDSALVSLVFFPFFFSFFFFQSHSPPPSSLSSSPSSSPSPTHPAPSPRQTSRSIPSTAPSAVDEKIPSAACSSSSVAWLSSVVLHPSSDQPSGHGCEDPQNSAEPQQPALRGIGLASC